MLGTRFLMLLLFLAGPLRIGSVTWTPEAVDPENRTGRVVLDYVLEGPAEEMEGLYVQISLTRDNIFYWKDDFAVTSRSGRRIGELEDLELDDGPSGPVLYDAEFTLYDHTGKKVDSRVQQIQLIDTQHE
jgi:hypothetical protein